VAGGIQLTSWEEDKPSDVLKFVLPGAFLLKFKLLIWTVTAILGMMMPLSAQEPGGMVSRHPLPARERRTAGPVSEQRSGPPGPISPQGRGVLPEPVSPQMAAAVACRGSFRPTWCGESDIGAWTNAAIALIGCGEVYIPAGSYTQKTSILKPRCVKLTGASGYATTLTYTASTGCAVVISDNAGTSTYAPGAVEDLNLIGPGAGPPADTHATSTCGVYFGGSDGGPTSPPQSIDPITNYGDHANLNRVRVSHFGVGLQFGFNAFNDTIFESVIASDGTGVSIPASVTGANPTSNSGENITLLASSVLNNAGVGLFVGTGILANVNVVNTSFDFNQSWAIENGTSATQTAVSIVNGYIVQPSRWIRNFGYMNLEGVYATDGSASGQLGYLIDNQASFLTVTGGQFFNGGSGKTLNPSGACSVWVGALVTPGLTGLACGSAVDRFGDAGFAALSASSAVVSGGVLGRFLSGDALNQNTANHLAGTASCSSGTATVNFSTAYASQPVILLFDETTEGGVKLSSKSPSGFSVACTGGSDVFDWIVIGNPR
jgi:hypothetical protein